MEKIIGMAIFKKIVRFLVILFLVIILLFLGLTQPVWPSKNKLCQDLESHIQRKECVHLDNRIAIIRRAFPEGETSSSDVKKALGAYLNAEYPTKYGHLEEYYLSVRPIDYLINTYDSYRFGYDSNGVLVAFSYED